MDVERLEEDFGRLLAVLRGVQRWFSLCDPIPTMRREISVNAQTRIYEITDQKEVMVLRLCTEILEDRLFPVPLHVIPVVDLTMANRVVDTVSRRLRISKRFIANEEVKVLDPSLRGEIARLCWYWGTRSA